MHLTFLWHCGLCISLQLNIAQSELDIYLSNQQSETNKLKEMEKNLEKAKSTLEDRTKWVIEKNLEKTKSTLEDRTKWVIVK